MSFANHDLAEDVVAERCGAAGADGGAGGGGVGGGSTRELSADGVRACPRRGNAAVRVSGYAAGAGAAMLTVCAVKCVLLYVVLPAFAVGAAAVKVGESLSTSSEKPRVFEMPASCPVTGARRTNGDTAEPRSGRDAAVGDAQGVDAASAR